MPRLIRKLAILAKIETTYGVSSVPAAINAMIGKNPSFTPLEADEVEKIKEILPLIWNDLTPQSQAIIEAQGVSYIDEDGEPVTSIVNGRECVFTYTDESGICKCAIEKAFREGKTDFYKPISCHLYPIRLQRYNDFTAVNYHRWSICKCARTLGSKANVRVYEFLKEPLIRRFGNEWYEQVCIASKEINI